MRKTTLDECISAIKSEKDNKLTSRFPCRVLLIHSRQGYQNAVRSLSMICDRTISSEELFAGADTLPAYDKVVEKLTLNEWVLLPGVSEYLRLFHDSEARSGRFMKLWHQMVDASNRGRIIIPLWNCDALWHDKNLGMETDIRQEKDVWYIQDESTEPETLNIRVFSDVFEKYISQLGGKHTLIVGLREWYEHLSEDSAVLRDYYLLSKQWRTIAPCVGDITIQTVKDTYSFVRENLTDGTLLKQELCTPEILNELLNESLKNISLNDAIKGCFNVVSFDVDVIIASWNALSLGKKQLLKLWYQLNPDDSYLCMCLTKSEVNELEYNILHSVFDVLPFHPEWVDEYRKLVSCLKPQKDKKFFEQLDNIPIYEDRIPFLTSDTRDERIYIIRMVGSWLKKSSSQVRSSEALKNLYPALFMYLQDMPANIDRSFSDYIFMYKFYKIANILPELDEQFLHSVNPETLPYRYAVLSQNVNAKTVVLWIDALGFEYMSLLFWVLGQDKKGCVKTCELVQATLPTETAFNEQWKSMNVQHKKLDKLDKLAHKGVVDEPDYYTCVEEQIEFFSNKITNVVDDLLSKYERVIVTGDHGTSRLAAKFFHKREGITPPNGSKVFSHGRYCQIFGGENLPFDFIKRTKDAAENQYLVISSYHHFTIGGFAAGDDEYGEIHGGASPEEMIVPVVVFENKKKLPLEVELKDETVKLKKGIVKFKIGFNMPVQSLQVSIDGRIGECLSVDKLLWTVQVEGLSPGSYTPVIVADGKINAVDKKLDVKSAIGGDGDLL